MRLARQFLIGATATMLGASAAMAADVIIIPPPAPPPPMALAPVVSPFAGLYFGGYGYFPLPLGGPSRSFGGQVGYNFGTGNLLFGVQGRVGYVTPGLGIHADIGARAGFVLGDRVLLYGGAAVGVVPNAGPFRYLSAGVGAEFLIGETIGIFGEFRHVWQLPLGGLQQNMLAFGINFHP